jgi:hypothetical protein
MARVRACLLFLALPALGACDHAAAARAEPARSAAPVALAVPAASAPTTPPRVPHQRPIDRKAYAWLTDPGAHAPAPVDTLQARFPAPQGFSRVRLSARSFGAWLRGLPLAAPGTPVVSYAGTVLHPASDPRIAAVVAIDVGKADLQQCADAVIRMNAEWQWSKGRRDMTYRAASGTLLPFSRWARGERVRANGANIRWQPASKPASDHRAFRHYLDAVFAWANTVSVARQAKRVKPADLAPGDFFIMPGNPGHSVLVLDLARDAQGRRVALLGQSYMPAQSFQVLRPAPKAVWFELKTGDPVKTPFWRPFPWTTLERFDN